MFLLDDDANLYIYKLESSGASLLSQYRILDGIEALSLIHISEPTRLLSISYAVFCLKKKTQQ